MQQRGLTLVELLIGAALLLGGGGALLMGMQGASVHTHYLSQFQRALQETQGQLEALSATSFDTLATGAAFAAARGLGQCRAIGEDANCNGVLDPGEDVDGSGALEARLPGGRMAIQIKDPDGSAPGADSTLLDLVVAACWPFRGRPIGEDQNCNGQLDPGEDANHNGWIDAPVMVSTRVGRRE